MGFLDMFDNPDVMSQLLGIGDLTGSGMPAYNPFTAPSQTGAPAPAPPQQPGTPPVPLPQASPATAPQVPLPQPRPASAPQLPAQATLPMNAQPAMAPPPASGGAPPVATAGGLENAFNVSPNAGALRPYQPPSPWQVGLASLGKGLQAVGGLNPRASAAQAIGAGAGGAITGGIDYQEAQKKQLFDQSSTAFRDMMAAKTADNQEAYRKAQGNFLDARAAAIGNGGGAGSGAYQNSPYWKVMTIEKYAKDEKAKQQTLLAKQWQLNGSSPEQQQDDLANLEKNIDSYRNRLYATAGIKPQDGQKILEQGIESPTTADGKQNPKFNPFDTKGMTLDQFNQQVPMGAWFKDQTGTVRQRTVPPTGAAAGTVGGALPQAGQTQAPGAAASPQLTYDDMTALQPQ